jgi:hypothetical protein
MVLGTRIREKRGSRRDSGLASMPALAPEAIYSSTLGALITGRPRNDRPRC